MKTKGRYLKRHTGIRSQNRVTITKEVVTPVVSTEKGKNGVSQPFRPGLKVRKRTK